ncbi:MAG: hypothetical protein M1829_003076 [Trizodia sp. TS-e1964]|nr:MAG: hypothetical protein M1829_003076 [Trizodia sp. TS-e1964]
MPLLHRALLLLFLPLLTNLVAAVVFPPVIGRANKAPPDVVYCDGDLRVYRYTSGRADVDESTAFGCLTPEGTYGRYPGQCGRFRVLKTVYNRELRIVIQNWSLPYRVTACAWLSGTFSCGVQLMQANSGMDPVPLSRRLREERKMLRSSVFGLYRPQGFPELLVDGIRVGPPPTTEGGPYEQGEYSIVCYNSKYTVGRSRDLTGYKYYRLFVAAGWESMA